MLFQSVCSGCYVVAVHWCVWVDVFEASGPEPELVELVLFLFFVEANLLLLLVVLLVLVEVVVFLVV